MRTFTLTLTTSETTCATVGDAVVLANVEDRLTISGLDLGDAVLAFVTNETTIELAEV